LLTGVVQQRSDDRAESGFSRMFICGRKWPKTLSKV
jgi:hypothetical protein